MLGAVGGLNGIISNFQKSLKGTIEVKKRIKTFANLRPVICFKQLVDASTLKPEIVSGLDIMIMRTYRWDLFWRTKRIKPIDNGEKRINTHSILATKLLG